MKPAFTLSALVWTILAATLFWAPVSLAQAPEGREYVVQADDWLSKIAEKEYGDPLAYPAIVEATNTRAAEDASFATMYRDDRYKLVVYHGHDLGELYDLHNDPDEFNNLWDEPEFLALRGELIRRSFDASILGSIDVGTRRIGPM